jgi:hypothetical protein
MAASSPRDTSRMWMNDRTWRPPPWSWSLRPLRAEIAVRGTIFHSCWRAPNTLLERMTTSGKP